MIFWFAPKRFWDIINQRVDEELYGKEPVDRIGRFDYIKSLRIPKVPTPTVQLTEKGKGIVILGLVLIAVLLSSDR